MRLRVEQLEKVSTSALAADRYTQGEGAGNSRVIRVQKVAAYPRARSAWCLDLNC